MPPVSGGSNDRGGWRGLMLCAGGSFAVVLHNVPRETRTTNGTAAILFDFICEI